MFKREYSKVLKCLLRHRSRYDLRVTPYFNTTTSIHIYFSNRIDILYDCYLLVFVVIS